MCKIRKISWKFKIFKLQLSTFNFQLSTFNFLITSLPTQQCPLLRQLQSCARRVASRSVSL